MASTSQQLTNWLELPPDITANILHRVGAIDIFENVQKVCTTWHKICKAPEMWRVIHMDGFLYFHEMPRLRLDEICKLAVNRSQGQMIDFTIVAFDKDEILLYVADRASKLRRLEITYCLFRSWNEALKKFPLLEELNFYSTNISKEAIETAGRYCPMLKTLKVNRIGCRFWAGEDDEESIMIDNEFAKAIGENLTDLRHLELVGCCMSNVGLQVILDGCRHLESLDLRDCRNIDLNKHLLKRCSELIKHLKLPNDSLEGCPYLYEYADTTKPGLMSDEHIVYDDYYSYTDFCLEQDDDQHLHFDDYDTYVDYCLEQAAVNARFNNHH